LIVSGFGGPTNSSSGVGSVVSYVSIVAGREYTTRLFLWDSWDNEAGELHVRRSSDNGYDYYIQVWRTVNSGITSINNFGNGATYTWSVEAERGRNGWNDAWIDVTFVAKNSGTLTTWTNLNESAVTNEAWELFQVREFYSNTSYTSGARALSLNTTSGQITGSKNIADVTGLTVNTNNISSSLSGVISGSGSMTKEGTGALTLSANNIYIGGTTVNAGTLILSDSYASVGNGVIVGTLNVNANGTVQLTNNPGAFGWGSNRVTTININSGLVEVIGAVQHIWNATLNFNGGGTLRSNSGNSSASTTSFWEWGGVTVNVTGDEILSFNLFP
jgi:autotransporter-associated beta strand protein